MQFFLVLAVIVCVAAGLLIRRNRERARNAPLRSEINTQVRFETTLGLRHTFILRDGYWQTERGQGRLTVGTDAFIISAPQALREYAFSGCQTSITRTQMQFGPAGRDCIVITGPAGGRQIQLAIMPDNLPGTWNALAATGALTP